MYKPKDSSRCFPKVSLPIRLDDQCLNAAVDLLAKTGEKSKRQSREKKSARKYLSRLLPVSIQKRILERAAERLGGAQSTLSILDILGPSRVVKNHVDLLGPFRFVGNEQLDMHFKII